MEPLLALLPSRRCSPSWPPCRVQIRDQIVEWWKTDPPQNHPAPLEDDTIAVEGELPDLGTAARRAWLAIQNNGSPALASPLWNDPRVRSIVNHIIAREHVERMPDASMRFYWYWVLWGAEALADTLTPSTCPQSVHKMVNGTLGPDGHGMLDSTWDSAFAVALNLLNTQHELWEDVINPRPRHSHAMVQLALDYIVQSELRARANGVILHRPFPDSAPGAA